MKAIGRPALIEALEARLAGHMALDGQIFSPGFHRVFAVEDLTAGVLLKMLAGLEPLSLGSVRWNGIDVWQMNADEMSARRLRYPFVPRGGGLLPHLTLEENAALPLIYHTQEPHDRVEHKVGELFRHFGLSTFGSRLPGEVPVPLRRRAALARALTSTPSVMFLEDPFEGDTDLATPLATLRAELDMTVLLTGEVPPDMVLEGALEWTEHP